MLKKVSYLKKSCLTSFISVSHVHPGSKYGVPALSYCSHRTHKFELCNSTSSNSFINDIILTVERKGWIERQTLENALVRLNFTDLVCLDDWIVLAKCCVYKMPLEHATVKSKILSNIWNTLKKKNDLNINCEVKSLFWKLLILNKEENVEADLTVPNFKLDECNEKDGCLLLKYAATKQFDKFKNLYDEALKKPNLVDNEFLDSALYGCTKQGNGSSVKAILDFMQASKIPPNSSSYLAVLCGALEGNHDSLFEIYHKKFTESGFFFSCEELNILFSFAKDSSFLFKVIDNIPITMLDFPTSTNLLLHLLGLELPNLQLHLLKKILSSDNRNLINIKSLVEVYMKEILNKNGVTSHLVKICSLVKEYQIMHEPLLFATKCVLKKGNVSEANDIMRILQQGGNPIRIHYFWPLLAQITSGDVAGILEIIEAMKTFNMNVNDVETLENYTLPPLSHLDKELVMNKLVKAGLSLSAVMNVQVKRLLLSRHPQEALRYASKYRFSMQPEYLMMPSVINSCDNFKEVFEIMHLALRQSSNDNISIMSEFILKCMNFRMSPSPLTVAKTLASKKVCVRPQAFEAIVGACTSRMEASDIERMLKDCIGEVSSRYDGDIVYNHPNDMSVSELESHLIELEVKKMNTRGILRKLLLQYCRLKDITKASHIVEKLRDQNAAISPGMYSSILEVAIETDNLEKALETRQLLRNLYPKFFIDTHKDLGLASLMAKNKDFQACYEHVRSLPVWSNTKYRVVMRNCLGLLEVLRECREIDTLSKVTDCLVEKNYLLPDNLTYRPQILLLLDSDKIEEAVSVFIKLANEHQITPGLDNILRVLLDRKLDQLLRSIVESSRKVAGDDWTHNKVALSHFTRLEFRTGLDYLNNNDVFINNKLLLHLCERMFKEDDIEFFELLLSETSSYKNIDRRAVYNFLYRLYKSRGEVQAVKEISHRLEEEGYPLLEDMVRYLKQQVA